MDGVTWMDVYNGKKLHVLNYIKMIKPNVPLQTDEGRWEFNRAYIWVCGNFKISYKVYSIKMWYTTAVHNTKDNLMSLQFEKEVEKKFVLKVEQWM